MDLYDAMHTSASGLSAQRLRMNLISANLANVNTTRTAEGGPFSEANLLELLALAKKGIGELVDLQRQAIA